VCWCSEEKKKVKILPGGKVKPKEPNQIIISRTQRAKRKYITTVVGTHTNTHTHPLSFLLPLLIFICKFFNLYESNKSQMMLFSLKNKIQFHYLFVSFNFQMFEFV
jgi:hypothetical protein